MPKKTPTKYNKIKLNPSLAITKAGLVKMTHQSSQIRRAPRQTKPSSGVQGVTVPASYGAITRKAAPISRTLPNGRQECINTELFTTIVGPGDSNFLLPSYNLNPALTNMGRWLPSQSRGYTKHMYVYCVVTYEPITGTDTEGAIYMAWEPNALEDVPTDKFQMSALINSTSNPVWAKNKLVIPASKELFIRRGAVTGATLTSFDHGKLLIASSDTGANTGGLGDLRIEYVVHLFSPHTDVSNLMAYGNYWIRGSAGVSNTLPLGTGRIIAGNTRILDVTTLVQSTNSFSLKFLDVPSVNNNGFETWVVIFRILTIGAAGGTTAVAMGNGTVVTSLFGITSAGQNYTEARFSTTTDPTGVVVTFNTTTTTMTVCQVDVSTAASTNDLF